MTREEAEKYIKSEMCKNCSVYLGGGKCSEKCNVIEAIKALEIFENQDRNDFLKKRFNIPMVKESEDKDG